MGEGAGGEGRAQGLRVNGQVVAVPEPPTVAGLVGSLGLGAGVAVALNQQVVPRSAWAEAALKAGDEVEVIRAVQGG